MVGNPGFLTWDDLIQEARIGLMYAVEIQDTKPDDVQWSTFAKMHMLKQMRRYGTYGPERSIRMPEYIHVQIGLLRKAKDLFIQYRGYEPDNVDLAEYTGLDVEKIEHLTGFMPESIEALDEDDDGNTAADLGQDYFDFVSGDEVIDADPMELQTLEEVLGSPMVSDREVDILYESVVESKPLEEIGDDLGISRQRVHQIQQRAMRRIRSDARMRRIDRNNNSPTGPDVHTGGLYKLYDRNDPNGDVWWGENTIPLEDTMERRKQWAFGSRPTQMLGFKV